MAATAQAPPASRYPARLTLRAPLGLPQAIEAAARSQLTSPSEYVRRALLSALSADGIHLDANGKILARASDSGQEAQVA